jgi:hypothetical protein
VPLDLAVPVLEDQRRVDGRPRSGQLDDPTHAGRPGEVDRRALVPDLVPDVGAGEEEPVDPVEGPLQRSAVGEVADGELGAVAQQAPGPLRVADERAGGDAASAQVRGGSDRALRLWGYRAGGHAMEAAVPAPPRGGPAGRTGPGSRSRGRRGPRSRRARTGRRLGDGES